MDLNHHLVLPCAPWSYRNVTEGFVSVDDDIYINMWKHSVFEVYDMEHVAHALVKGDLYLAEHLTETNIL